MSSKIDGNGKRPKYGGRKPGSRNKVAADVRELAQKYGPEIVKKLVTIVRNSKSEMSVIAASKELLDRAYGKALQPLHHEGEIKVTHEEAIRLIHDRILELEAEQTQRYLEN